MGTWFLKSKKVHLKPNMVSNPMQFQAQGDFPNEEETPEQLGGHTFRSFRAWVGMLRVRPSDFGHGAIRERQREGVEIPCLCFVRAG